MTPIDAASGGGWLTRRRFIDSLAALGGVSLAMAGMEALGFGFASAQAAPPRLSAGRTAKVVILGAGLAGMTAAYELTKAGYECQVLEARSFAGGRCQTARRGFTHTDLAGRTQVCDFDEGLYLNNGPWRIPYHHASTLHYTRLFGVPLEIMVNDNDASYVYFEHGSGPLAGKAVRKGEVAADTRGYAAELLAKAARKGDLDTALSVEDRDLFTAYLINEGRLSPKDLGYHGDEGRGFAVLPGAGLDPGPGKASTPYDLKDLLGSRTWAVLTSVARYDQQRTMFQPVGGMDRIAKGFERHVGHLIRYGAKATRLAQSPDGVEVSYTDASGEPSQVKADYCICTIPLSVLRSLDLDISGPFRAAMAQVAYAPVNKVGLQMKRRFWEEDHGIYGGHVYLDNPDIGTITLPSSGWQGDKGVILGMYSFGANAVRLSARSPADRAAFAVAAGQKVFPEYAESFETGFAMAWHLDAHNLGGWADWSEESRRAAYPVLVEPDGRLYLAGEHMTYIGAWQAAAIESAWSQIARLHARVQVA